MIDQKPDDLAGKLEIWAVGLYRKAYRSGQFAYGGPEMSLPIEAIRDEIASIVRNEPSAEYFTGHSEGCNGKCGKGGFSSNSADYCEDQRKLLGRPSAVEALREMNTFINRHQGCKGDLLWATDICPLVFRLDCIDCSANVQVPRSALTHSTEPD